MMHVAEFGLDLSEAESFENKETYHRALLERAHRVRCTFNTFCDGSGQRVCSAGNRTKLRWIPHGVFFLAVFTESRQASYTARSRQALELLAPSMANCVLATTVSIPKFATTMNYHTNLQQVLRSPQTTAQLGVKCPKFIGM
jgi:hypothetical protein